MVRVLDRKRVATFEKKRMDDGGKGDFGVVHRHKREESEIGRAGGRDIGRGCGDS